MTVADVLTRALTDLGIIQAGETPSDVDSATAFDYFNDWLDGNKLLDGLVYTKARTVWSIGSASSYTVGSQANINIARPRSPSDIEGIAYYDTSITPFNEISVALYTDDEYRLITQKTLTSTYPVGFHYETTFGVNGWGTLKPWPIPTSSTLKGVIYTKSPVDEFAATSDTVYVPPGYRRFFRSNLAKEMAAAFGVPVPPQVDDIAKQSKHDIQTANLRQSDLGFDPDLIFPLYDINSDTNWH